MPNLKGRRPRRLTPEERKSLTHGDFWIPDAEADAWDERGEDRSEARDEALAI